MHKLLLDENLSYQYVSKLEGLGYDVLHVYDIASGISDHEVLGAANMHGRILITQDTDFVRMIFAEGHMMQYSLVLVKASLSTKRELFDRLVIFLSHRSNENPMIVVLDETNIRTRSIPNSV